MNSCLDHGSHSQTVGKLLKTDFERKSAEFLSGSTEIRYLGHDLVDPDFAVVDFEGDVSEHVAHERLVVGLLALRVELNSGHRHFEGSTR